MLVLCLCCAIPCGRSSGGAGRVAQKEEIRKEEKEVYQPINTTTLSNEFGSISVRSGNVNEFFRSDRSTNFRRNEGF